MDKVKKENEELILRPVELKENLANFVLENKIYFADEIKNKKNIPHIVCINVSIVEIHKRRNRYFFTNGSIG